jgi:hypothetical protein
VLFLRLRAYGKNVVDLKRRNKMGPSWQRFIRYPSKIYQHAHIPRRDVRQRCPGKNDDQQQPYANQDRGGNRLWVRGDNSGIEMRHAKISFFMLQLAAITLQF